MYYHHHSHYYLRIKPIKITREQNLKNWSILLWPLERS
jgi:hypothetical protein